MDYSALNRKQLQAEAKKRGVKANGKSVDIIEALKELDGPCDAPPVARDVEMAPEEVAVINAINAFAAAESAPPEPAAAKRSAPSEPAAVDEGESGAKRARRLSPPQPLVAPPPVTVVSPPAAPAPAAPPPPPPELVAAAAAADAAPPTPPPPEPVVTFGSDKKSSGKGNEFYAGLHEKVASIMARSPAMKHKHLRKSFESFSSSLLDAAIAERNPIASPGSVFSQAPVAAPAPVVAAASFAPAAPAVPLVVPSPRSVFPPTAAAAAPTPRSSGFRAGLFGGTPPARVPFAAAGHNIGRTAAVAAPIGLMPCQKSAAQARAFAKLPAAKKKTIEAAQARRGAFAKSGAAGRASALAARRGF